MHSFDSDRARIIAADLIKIRRDALQSLGKEDVAHIRHAIKLVMVLEVLGRGLLFFSFYPAAWGAGIFFLALSKIIENTEVGHNVMHGQYDWTGDPRLSGKAYEFDAVATSDNWRTGHNVHHHLNTGIQGLDNDVGLLRFSRQQQWRWYHLFQMVFALLSALFAQWGVAVQNMRLGDLFSGKVSFRYFVATRALPFFKKSIGRVIKDYIIFPLLAGPFFFNVFLANLIANGVRNVWVWMVIAAGHCVGGVRLYSAAELKDLPAEHWYVRQIVCSANFRSGPFLAVMTGHLGFHIEHHLFPTVPSCRYRDISVQVRAVCSKYDLPYNSRSFIYRVFEVILRLIRFSFP